mmetsp:Transcript_62763/g.152818  ORF Transcript_62763/g.152818 Transcript_62763/m.152818 type:complete len:681 (+) Transcript_62763:42-2084(+)
MAWAIAPTSTPVNRNSKRRGRRRRRALSSCSASSISSSSMSSLSYASDDDDHRHDDENHEEWSSAVEIPSSENGKRPSAILLTSSINAKSSKLLKNSKLLVISASAVIVLVTLFNFWNDRYALSIVVSKRVNCRDSDHNNSGTDACSQEQQQQQHQSSSSFIISSLTETTALETNAVPPPTESTETNNLDGYHFCGKSQVFPLGRDGDDQQNSLHLLYQCSGEAYDNFASSLQKLAANKTSSDTTSSSSSSQEFWGRRHSPLPPNVTVLALGNSHLRQVSKTLACQYSRVLTRIDFLQQPTLLSRRGTRRHRRSRRLQKHFDHRDDKDQLQTPRKLIEKEDFLSGESYPSDMMMVPTSATSPDAFVLEFENGSRWISITNTVLAYSQVWNKLVDRIFLSQVARLKQGSESNVTQPVRIHIDAVVFGKFTTYEESINTNFHKIMMNEQEAYMRVWDHEPVTFTESRTDTNGTNGTNDFQLSQKPNNVPMGSTNSSRWVDFENVPPPQLVDIARVYSSQKIIAVSMFSKKDVPSAQSNLETYTAELQHQLETKAVTHGDNAKSQTSPMLNASNQSGVNSRARSSPDIEHSLNKDVFFLNGRKYIEQLGIECGSDDKDIVGHCKEPMNSTESVEVTADASTNSTNGENKRRDRVPSDMHRCAGSGGGHADLISFDVIELMYKH